MEERFTRNFPPLTLQEQQCLSEKHVLVLGCGGLGGYLCEYLVRLGVGEITAVDPDRFESSNLNRQVLSTSTNLGMPKVLAAQLHAREIDPTVRFHGVEARFSEENAAELLAGKHLVLDALDNAADRLRLEDACAQVGLTIVHGAVHGWTAQAAVVLPGNGLLHRLFREDAADPDHACLSFTPAWCAAVQTAEAAKLLIGKKAELENRLLIADLKTMDTVIIAP